MTAPAVVTEVPAATLPVTPAASPAVTPAAPPAVEPAAPLPAAPVVPAKLEGPHSRREAKQALQESIRQRVAKAAETVAPVVAPEVRTSDVPPVAGTPAPAAIPPVVAPVTAPVAPQLILIPIPEGHPLREMGVTELVARNPQEERAQRANINSYTRRQEVATLQAKVDEYQRKEAEQAARKTAEEQWRARPEYRTVMEKAQELRDSHGDEVADQFLRGFNADFDKMAQQEIEARVGEIDQQRIAEAGERWTNEARTRGLALPESIRALPIFNQVFDAAVQSFNAELGLGHYPQLQPGMSEEMHQEFFRFLNARLRARPEVVALVGAVSEREARNAATAAARAAEEQRRIEKLKQDAVEEWKRQEAAKVAASPPHPLGNLAAVSRDRVPVGSEAAEPAANVPMSQVRRDARAAAVQRAKQRFGMT